MILLPHISANKPYQNLENLYLAFNFNLNSFQLKKLFICIQKQEQLF